ncbi:MAG TPA: ubiquitin-like domain-containing protein [Cryptosporangiaceae bacterium]|nr:ubiquitin-like domain-containing protein [Cryptosporangiaceae bacterium]
MGRNALLGIRCAAVVVLVAGALAWVATNRAVTVRVDGVARVVHSHASDVRGVLAAAGVRPSVRDEVVPALRAKVRSGDTVNLNRARQVTLTVDGLTRRVWVTTPTVGELLVGLRLRTDRLVMSAARSARLPLHGATLRVNTEKRLTLVADGKRTRVVSFAGTVAELLAERKVTLDHDDRTKPARSAPLRDGHTVAVQRITIKPATETVDVRPTVRRLTDADLMVDQTRIVTAGRPGRERQQVHYVYADRKLVERKVVARTVLVKSSPKVVRVGTKPYPTDPGKLNWAALAQCESGGRPDAVSPNGMYHGLYQFSLSTWRRVGGVGLPSRATPREQTYRAIKLYEAAGVGQWPHCGPRLFS